MIYQISNPFPNVPVLTFDDLTYFLRLDPDTAADPNEATLVNDMIAAATIFAEESMAMSLVNRTITATYWHDHHRFPGSHYGLRDSVVPLPRGPVVPGSVTVTDNGIAVTNAVVEAAGNADLLYLPSGWAGPLVVTYTAGLGPDATTVPSDIRMAIRTHAGTMYENRESVSDKSMAVVPHSLEAFYGRRARQTPVA
jgi:hypothetical protein